MWVEGQQGSTSGGDPLTPSNATPAEIALNHVYEAQGNGYAIKSYRTVTPDDLNPPFINAGEIVKVSTLDGYLRNTIPKSMGPLFAASSQTLLASVPETNNLTPLSEDGVLVGAINVGWNTAKNSEVRIDIMAYARVPGSDAYYQWQVATAATPALGGGRHFSIEIGYALNGILVAKGARVYFTITAPAGGTRTLTNTMKIYGVEKQT